MAAMLAGALLWMAVAVAPGGGSYLGLRLTLGDVPPPAPTFYPPPPPIVNLNELNEPPPAAPPAPSGSSGAAFAEAYAADLALRSVFEGVGFVALALSVLSFSPPCGGTPNPAAGLLLGLLAAGALVGQPFAISAIVEAIFTSNGHPAHYWAVFAGDLVATLVAGPLLGLVVGEAAAAAMGNQGSTPAILGLAVLDLVGAAGAPTAAVLSDTAGAPAPRPAHAAVGIPFVQLAFD